MALLSFAAESKLGGVIENFESKCSSVVDPPESVKLTFVYDIMP
jgi:hypothetical protein